MPAEKLSPKPIVCLTLSAAIGGCLATLADMLQKEEASAVKQVKLVLGKILGWQTTPAEVALVLIALSVALCFIFKARTNKAAFYIGASIIALLMTGVPYHTPAGFDSAGPTSSGGGPAPAPQASVESSWVDKFLIPPRVFAQSVTPFGQTRVEVHLETEDKKAVGSTIYTLLDPSNGQILARTRVSGSNFAFYVGNGSYLLQVQVDGYTIAERTFNPPPKSLTISLTPSSIPLAIQRIFRR